MEPSAVRSLSGWGRFPVAECRVFRPEKTAAISEILETGEEPSYIARGLGRSYGDASLNGGAGVICFERLNRFLAFDPETGVLEAEAGATLAEILESFLPRGFFPPVTPGTKFVTLGGAIAHDVHGKNHHRVGSISSFVESLVLQTPRGEILECSARQNADVFDATVGGAGLTGFIRSARLRLQPVETAHVVVDFQKTRDLEGGIAAMNESDHLYEFSVAWIDCLARGRSLGRSVLMRANPAKRTDLSSRSGDPLAIRRRGGRLIPFDLPGGLLNPRTVGAFNALFYAAHRTVEGHLADIDSFFYPLDSIRHWNRMYGRRGFVQYQVAFPPDTGPKGLARLLERVSASGRASFLGVLKRFGAAGRGLLSFPFPGYTLALDIPVSNGLVGFLHELDAVVLDHGGRLYLAKDATTTAATFAAMYPRLPDFQEVKARLDPDNRLSSSQARRLGIVAG
jgi:decaprenylphospho-beta-D-ribofuranose 2-oxidase